VTGERLPGHVEIVELILGEQLEELYQGGVDVLGDGCLVGTVTKIVLSIAKACVHQIVHIMHRVRVRPRMITQLEHATVALVRREWTIYVEYTLQAGRSWAAL